MSTKHSVLLVLITIALGTVPLVLAEDAKPSHPDIVEKLKLIVSLRQKQADLQRALVAENRLSDSSEAELALCRAQIDLARERGQQPLVVDSLERILTIYQAQYARAQLLAKKSVKSKFDELKIQILQTEIELMRVQNGPPTSDK